MFLISRVLSSLYSPLPLFLLNSGCITLIKKSDVYVSFDKMKEIKGELFQHRQMQPGKLYSLQLYALSGGPRRRPWPGVWQTSDGRSLLIWSPSING